MASIASQSGPQFRLPRDDEHALVVGKTGSGKTHGGMWHLSLRSYNIRPWIITDIKLDPLIAQIDPYEIDVRDKIPTEPGLYCVRPRMTEFDLLDPFYMRCWEAGGIGNFIDESYALGQNNMGYRTLLMQGRAIQCPTVSLSQKPVYVDRYATSQPEHFHVYRLSDRRDWKTIGEFTPLRPNDRHYGKDRHNSLWYNASDDHVFLMPRAPDRDHIVETFERRRPRRKQVWL